MPYHEFYLDDFRPRSHYQSLWEHIRQAGQNVLAEKARDSHLALHTEGVTFTVYDDSAEGIERVWPFDLLPRIIPAREWAPLEAGLRQRIRALNLFLKDLLGDISYVFSGALIIVVILFYPRGFVYVGQDLKKLFTMARNKVRRGEPHGR
jgi:uncharacterized circularly permuted ATP-grasp superfamily protein